MSAQQDLRILSHLGYYVSISHSFPFLMREFTEVITSLLHQWICGLEEWVDSLHFSSGVTKNCNIRTYYSIMFISQTLGFWIWYYLELQFIPFDEEWVCSGCGGKSEMDMWWQENKAMAETGLDVYQSHFIFLGV